MTEKYNARGSWQLYIESIVFNYYKSKMYNCCVVSANTLTLAPLTNRIRGDCREPNINHQWHDATAIFMVLEPYQLVGKSTCHGTIKETRLKISAVIKKRKHYYMSNTEISYWQIWVYKSYPPLDHPSTKVPSNYKHYW